MIQQKFPYINQKIIRQSKFSVLLNFQIIFRSSRLELPYLINVGILVHLNSQKFSYLYNNQKKNEGKTQLEPEQDEMIRYLKNQEKMTSWKKLAKRLNINFPENQRSGKQCRQRYTNTARFSQEFEQNKTWSTNEDELLCSLYLEKGSKWTLFMKEFPNKSQNNIKNRFYSCLRKATRKLRELQRKFSSAAKNIIKSSMLVTVLELASRVQKDGSSVANIQINAEWIIFKLRKNILDLAFGNKDIQEQEFKQVPKLIHKMNYRFKCLGITKMKIKSKWEMNAKRLYYILGFETDINLSKTFSDQQTATFYDRSSISNQSQESILDQNSLEVIQQDPNLGVNEQESIIFTPSHCQVLEKEFCQILGIQYHPTFSNLQGFQLN